MLKTAAFAFAVGFSVSSAASASPEVPGGVEFVVGSVRDALGTPIVGARIRAFDASGAPLANGVTDVRGTFALAVTARAASVRVACAHCRPQTVSTADGTNLAIIVDRDRALERSVPDDEDLDALPYARIQDVLSLAPFLVESRDEQTVSDRGIGGGEPLVVDDGAASYDPFGFKSGFETFPNRYVRGIDVAGPEQSYRYGEGAGGGTISLDTMSPSASYGIDTGVASDFDAHPQFGAFAPSAGISSDDETLMRRADLDASLPFAGGSLRLGGDAASERTPFYVGDNEVSESAFRASYATASRHYETFADFSTSGSTLGYDDTYLSAYRATYTTADFRVEHPGPVDLSAGARYSSGREDYTDDFAPFDYHNTDVTAYLSAATSSEAGSVSAGVAATYDDIAATREYGDHLVDGIAITGESVIPSIDGRIKLSPTTAFRASYSEALDAPQANIVNPQIGYEPDDASLVEAGPEYDDGARFRASALLFAATDAAAQIPVRTGIGTNLVWEVAPHLDLRLWSLAGPSARGVAWATYGVPSGLRLDAIARRDPSTVGQTDLDGDVLVPAVPRLDVVLGTQRDGPRRAFTFGLRAR